MRAMERKSGKTDRQKALDSLMAVLMIAAMSYQATGNLFHEAAGVVFLLLLLAHNVINRKWYRSIPRGKYTLYRKVLLAVNVLTFAVMLTAMGTGIYISRGLFGALLGMREGYLLRPVHVAAGAWGTILVSIHAGLHIRLPGRKGPAFAAAGLVLAVCGIWAFLALDMGSRLVFQDTAMYWRAPSPVLFLANGAVMALFAGLASLAAGRVRRDKGGLNGGTGQTAEQKEK